MTSAPDVAELPVSPPPRPWEPLGVYLMRCASYLGMGVGPFMSWLGWRWEHGRPSRGLSFGVDGEFAGVVARALARDVDEIHGMTLRSFPFELFSDAALSGYGLPPRATTAGCFSCLRDRRWDLRWATTLITVCPVHLTYLDWRCSECHEPFGPDILWRLGDDEPPTSHGPSTRRCHGSRRPGARADLVDIHASAVTARLLDEARHGDAAAGRQVRDVLRFVRVLRDSDHAPKTPAGVGPDAPRLHRPDVVTALEASRASEKEAVALPGVRRAVIVYALRPAWPTVIPPLARWADDDVVTRVFEAAYVQAQAQVVPVVVPQPGARPADVATLPACVPASLISRPLRDVVADVDVYVDENVRVLIAVAAAQQAGPGAWTSRTAALGLSSRVAARAMALAQQLEASGRDEEFWTEIQRIRDELVSRTVPFRARVVALQYPRDHDNAVIGDIARRHDLPTRVVQSWLIERWACHPLGLLAGPLGTRVPRSPAPSLDREFGPDPWRLSILDVGAPTDAAHRRSA